MREKQQDLQKEGEEERTSEQSSLEGCDARYFSNVLMERDIKV